MPEGREQPPTPQAPARVTAGAGRLSPVQQAYAAYAGHATRCWACRSVDERCAEGEGLHKIYRRILEDAGRQLAGGEPR
jgi:hypothetical protein